MYWGAGIGWLESWMLYLMKWPVSVYIWVFDIYPELHLTLFFTCASPYQDWLTCIRLFFIHQAPAVKLCHEPDLSQMQNQLCIISMWKSPYLDSFGCGFSPSPTPFFFWCVSGSGRRLPAGCLWSRVHLSSASPARTESCCWTSAFRSPRAQKPGRDTCSSSATWLSSPNSSKILLI